MTILNMKAAKRAQPVAAKDAADQYERDHGYCSILTRCPMCGTDQSFAVFPPGGRWAWVCHAPQHRWLIAPDRKPVGVMGDNYTVGKRLTLDACLAGMSEVEWLKACGYDQGRPTETDPK